MYINQTAMTPLFPEDKRAELEDKALKIIKESSKLSGKISNGTKLSFYDIMKNMNGYYSNLIEGNPIHPLDIEKALNGTYFKDEKKREKVEENTAHIKTQDKIKERLEKEPDLNITSKEFISWIHKELYENLDKEFRKVEHEGEIIEIIPGKMREREVKVGTHRPPLSKSLNNFLNLFDESYSPDKLRNRDKIIAFSASHHRLVFIHPFLDGNGRVARLFSYAYAIKVGIDAGGIWSISRGLARTRDQYYSELNYADQARQGDLDGRGNLTAKGLESFCNYFLDTALDQLNFIDKILDLDTFENRLKKMLETKPLSHTYQKRAFIILKEIYTKGELKRSDVYDLVDIPERTLRDTVKRIKDLKLIKSKTHKSPLSLNFTVEDTIYLFPDLMPKYLEENIKEEIAEKKSEFSSKTTNEKFKVYQKTFKDRQTEIIANRELVRQLSLSKQKEVIEALDSILKITSNYDLFSTIIESSVKE